MQLSIAYARPLVQLLALQKNNLRAKLAPGRKCEQQKEGTSLQLRSVLAGPALQVPGGQWLKFFPSQTEGPHAAVVTPLTTAAVGTQRDHLFCHWALGDKSKDRGGSMLKFESGQGCVWGELQAPRATLL